MSVSNAMILCMVFYPFIIVWVIYKNRFHDYLFLTLTVCLGIIFSYIVFKSFDGALSYLHAAAIGFAGVIVPCAFILSIMNLLTKKE